jgi:hypothetical protein
MYRFVFICFGNTPNILWFIWKHMNNLDHTEDVGEVLTTAQKRSVMASLLKFLQE